MLKDILIYLSAFIGVFAVSYYALSLFSSRKYEKPRDFKDSELPTVSIVIPVLNEEKTVKRTIESALNLIYPKEKMEIILVDDGSTDGTYEIAKSIKDERLKVFFRGKDGGKGKAHVVNFGIPKAKGELIVTMDADSFVEKDALRKMVNYFTNEKVMCVTPSMAVYKPKGFLGRLQQAEYLVGIFLRKAFSTMNAIHVTPGAFSSYRKSFFDKYGLFDCDGHLTEDMEMALRIQSKGYSLKCSEDSVVYTNVPTDFKSLWKQRRRWYHGWIHLLLKYRKLFSKKYGHMGTIVLPVAVLSILISIILTIYILFSTLSNLKNEFIYLQSVNFSFSGVFDLSWFTIERFLFYFFSKPSSIILLIFLGISIFYLLFAKRRVREHSNALVGMVFFIIFYSTFLTFWWLTSAFYYFVLGKVSWGKQ